MLFFFPFFFFASVVLFVCTHLHITQLHLTIAASRKILHSGDWSHLNETDPGWSLGAQEGHWCPAQLQNILLGLVSWQHWLIGLVGLRKGLAQDRGIRSLPLIIFSLCSSESWGHSHKIKALPSCLRGAYYTGGGDEGDVVGFVRLLSLASSTDHHGVMLQLLTVTRDWNYN